MLFFTVWLRKKNRRDRKEERKFSLLGPLFLSSQNMRKMRREKCLEIHFTQIPSHLPLILFITWLFPLLILVTFFSQQSSNVLGSLSLSLSLSLALFNQHNNVWLFSQVKNVAQVKKLLPTKVCWPCLNKWKSFEHLTLLFADHVFLRWM